MGSGLSEPNAWINPDLGHPGGDCCGCPLEQEVANLRHHIVVDGLVLHGARVASHMNGHPAHTQVGRYLVQACAHVVDDGGSSSYCGHCNSGVAGVDGDPDRLDGDRRVGGQHLYDRYYAGHFLILVNR